MTHAHLDHIGGLPFVVSTRCRHSKGGISAQSQAGAENHLESNSGPAPKELALVLLVQWVLPQLGFPIQGEV